MKNDPPTYRVPSLVTRFVSSAKEFVAGEEGATVVEYALIIGLIAGTLVVTVTSLGATVKVMINQAAAGFGS